jgi:hypothetical protein
MAENYQTYKATIEITYSSEVFDGDPDDVFELASLEKPWVEDTLLSTVEIFDSAEKMASFVVVDVVPIVGE